MKSFAFKAGIVSASLLAFSPAAANAGTGVGKADDPKNQSSRVAEAKRQAISQSKASRTSGSDKLDARYVIVDNDGGTHIRFDKTFKGLKVMGGDLVIHQAPAGDYDSTSAAQAAAVPDSLSTSPVVSALDAVASALGKRSKEAESTLVIEARTATPRLAWLVKRSTVEKDGTPSIKEISVDATTGQIIFENETVQTVAGSGVGYSNGSVALDTTLSGTTYQLKDPTRGNTYTGDAQNKTDSCFLLIFCSTAPNAVFTDADNNWGTGVLSNRQTAAVDAQYANQVTWDLYKTKFGRLGIFNNGTGTYNRVHYGTNYANAFWSTSCNCMTYGDGDGTNYNPLTTLDVGGHEITHGVTSKTANLTYSGESGGLNESTSDIMGTLAEFYANNAKDVPDYKIGELVRKNGTPLRYMDDPSKDGSSAKCYSSTVGNLDVHYSSGIGNRFFYILAVGSGSSAWGNTGATCNGSTVTGIGNDAAGKIWYRALTTYMTSSTKYAGARTATISAATDLYGATSTQVATVKAAWSAVGVN